MQENLITRRRDWLRELSYRKKIDRSDFFCTLEKDLLTKKNEIFLLENSENTFFKYRPLNYNTIDSIKSNSIHLSAPKDFNDPFDTLACNFDLGFKKRLNSKQVDSLLRKYFDKISRVEYS